MMRRRVTWLHKTVYTVARKPAPYQDMSLALLVQGYMIIMNGGDGALKERMAMHQGIQWSLAQLCRGVPHGMKRRN